MCASMHKLDRVGYTCNLNTWEQRQEDCKFEVSLGYRVRLYMRETNIKMLLAVSSGSDFSPP